MLCSRLWGRASGSFSSLSPARQAVQAWGPSRLQVSKENGGPHSQEMHTAILRGNVSCHLELTLKSGREKETAERDRGRKQRKELENVRQVRERDRERGRER